MQCGGCGYDAPAEFAFCPKCGSKLSAACPSCGFACPPDFGFCPKCGARIASGEPIASAVSTAVAPPVLPSAEERLATLRELMPTALTERLEAGPDNGAAVERERRPVTVLFADLSGFTALAETTDPEDLATLLDRCLRAMAEAIYRYQGTVDKYIGDCVMALFGAPVAHEDDPERAIRAALEMRDQIAAIAAQGTSPLSLHVGINTGVVVAGAVGSDRRREYTVLGDAVNVAARLEGVATDGDIIVGEPSYRLARHVAAFE